MGEPKDFNTFYKDLVIMKELRAHKTEDASMHHTRFLVHGERI